MWTPVPLQLATLLLANGRQWAPMGANGQTRRFPSAGAGEAGGKEDATCGDPLATTRTTRTRTRTRAYGPAHAAPWPTPHWGSDGLPAERCERARGGPCVALCNKCVRRKRGLAHTRGAQRTFLAVSLQPCYLRASTASHHHDERLFCRSRHVDALQRSSTRWPARCVCACRRSLARVFSSAARAGKSPQVISRAANLCRPVGCRLGQQAQSVAAIGCALRAGVVHTTGLVIAHAQVLVQVMPIG